MRKDPIKQALQAVQDLRSQGASDDTVTALVEVVHKHPSIVVVQAAKLAAEWQVEALVPALETAFYRLSENGQEEDPQCWGKVALVKALHALAWQGADVYVQGCKAVQLEPVYGGKEDSAAPVRSASFRALVQLPAVATATIMTTLADLLVDESANVRAEAARSSIYCPAELTQPLLRLKIRTGDADSRVVGTCFDALLVVAPTEETVDLVLEYTHSKDALQAEALAALASSAVPEAVAAVTKSYPTLADAQVQRVVFTSLGASPTEQAFDFLCHLLGFAPLPEATWALDALKSQLYGDRAEAVADRVQVRRDSELLCRFQRFLAEARGGLEQC